MFSNVLCKCGGLVMLSDDVLSRSCLANRLCLSCDECCSEEYFWTSELCKSKPSAVLPKQTLFEVNTRFFYGLRFIGKGLEAGKMFWAMLNLPPPNLARVKHTKVISACSQVVAEGSMNRAAKEAVEEMNMIPIFV